MARLTRAEKDAVQTVLQEFLAGHDAEMACAAGFADTERKAETFIKRINRAVEKLG